LKFDGIFWKKQEYCDRIFFFIKFLHFGEMPLKKNAELILFFFAFLFVQNLKVSFNHKKENKNCF
jgi:hypothetical protein